MNTLKHTCSGIILILLVFTRVCAQEGYYNLTLSDFRENPSFNDTIDPEHPNSEILNAVLFYLTNEMRVKKKLPELIYKAEHLEKSAQLHSVWYGLEDDFFDHINSGIR
jgi:hypothetical protein